VHTPRVEYPNYICNSREYTTCGISKLYM